MWALSVAVAVKQAAPHLVVEVLEAAPEDAWRKDNRASAIIAAASRLLGVLGAWPMIEPDAEPIRRMVVTDSRGRRSRAPGLPDLRLAM